MEAQLRHETIYSLKCDKQKTYDIVIKEWESNMFNASMGKMHRIPINRKQECL